MASVSNDSIAALQEKCRALEAESHVLLNRAIQSEQARVDLDRECDGLKASRQELLEERANLRKTITDLKQANGDLAAQLKKINDVVGDGDIAATMAQLKSDCQKQNTLRLQLESNFADLSVQYDALSADHSNVATDLKLKTRDHESALESIERMKETVHALEAATAKAESDREDISKALGVVKAELAATVKAHDKTKEDLRRAQTSLAAVTEQRDMANNTIEKNIAEHSALKLKAQQWKKQADAALELDARNEQLVVQIAYKQKELVDAKTVITQLRTQLAAVEEEDRKRREQVISPKLVQFLKDQLVEATEKLKEVKGKEKGLVETIATLEAQVKRLRYELQKKNPSQMRLMEVEAQNELLIHMLQATSPQKTQQPKQGLRKLPPIIKPPAPVVPEPHPTPVKVPPPHQDTTAMSTAAVEHSPPPPTSEEGLDTAPRATAHRLTRELPRLPHKLQRTKATANHQTTPTGAGESKEKSDRGRQHAVGLTKNPGSVKRDAAAKPAAATSAAPAAAPAPAVAHDVPPGAKSTDSKAAVSDEEYTDEAESAREAAAKPAVATSAAPAAAPAPAVAHDVPPGAKSTDSKAAVSDEEYTDEAESARESTVEKSVFD